MTRQGGGRHHVIARGRVALGLSAVVACLFGVRATAVEAAPAPTVRQQIARAEQARDTSPAALAPVLKALGSRDPDDQRRAVRALGRFEQPALVPEILPLLAATAPVVRAEAANALAQAVSGMRRDDAASAQEREALVRVRQALLGAIRSESDPRASGVAAASLGRLPAGPPDQIAATEAALAALLPPPIPPATGMAVPARTLGILLGLDALARGRAPEPALDEATRARVRALSAVGTGSGDERLAEIRRLALQVLATVRDAAGPLIEQRIVDEDAEVRRLAMLIASRSANGDAGANAIARGLKDADATVRIEALRAYGAHRRGTGCGAILAAVDDPSSGVALQALDLLGSPCPDGPAVAKALVALMDGTARQPPGMYGRWQPAAHALIALAGAAPQEALPRVPRAAAAPIWQVRMYAARAATMVRDAATLQHLASDRDPNVREAALAGLAAVSPAAAADAAIAALGAPHDQVALAAARALHGAQAGARAVPALLAAFERLTRDGRQTSRDPRLAILDRLAEFGTPALAPRLSACAAGDVDLAVAQRCAALVKTWTGQAPQPRRRPVADRERDRIFNEVAGGVLDQARLRIVVEGRGSLEVRLFADEAPMSVATVLARARRGYYDGLTFHRVVGNFVVQGGSPGANEYVGDAAFIPDEPGVSNRRGTVGISSRGRDTGDAQFYVNLVDNTRLDHEYTVFGEVTSGMDVLEAIEEGDEMHSVAVVMPIARTPR